MAELTVATILVLGICYLGWLGYRGERADWNGGRCPVCNCFWRSFDMDSQGGRGYKCFGCAPVRRIWISWPIDKASDA